MPPVQPRPLDIARLRTQFATAEPFPYVLIDEFLEPQAAHDVAAAYPTFDTARGMGREFKAVNERRKVQVCDSTLFPAAVSALSDYLASPAFLAQLSEITGIRGLMADPALFGGGMHLTGPHGRLDVHVDFNKLAEDRYRRLNLLLYLNPDWQESWGGQIELWDRGVERCRLSVVPALNRCLIFETSDISFHGVAPLTCPPDRVRASFAAYYYTTDAPSPHARDGHGTIFRARPDERGRRYVLMPLERTGRSLLGGLRFTMGRSRMLAGRLLRIIGLR
jgi:hypothetical protein